VEKAMRLLRSTIPAGGKFAADHAQTPLYASVDSTQIEQVLINLCTNACHAMKGSAGRIGIGMAEVLLDQTAAQVSPDLHPGRYVRLSVTDDGSGMDEATQARMFDPFFTTKGVGLGTGLGLSVVHGIIKSHGGAITVKSAPGKGTTIESYWPIAEQEAPAQPAPAQPAPAQPAPAELPMLNRQSAHVLYVDDQESMVFLMTRMITAMGFRVSGFEDGATALQAVRGNPDDFDLVVTDFNMPGLSGLEVAKELQRIRPGLPVVITSGYITEELAASARAVGVRQVLCKQDTVDELCESIQRLLERVDA